MGVFLATCRKNNVERIEASIAAQDDTISIGETMLNDQQSKIEELENEAKKFLKNGNKLMAKTKLEAKRLVVISMNRTMQDIQTANIRKAKLGMISIGEMNKISTKSYVDAIKYFAQQNGINDMPKLSDALTEASTDLKQYEDELDKINVQQQGNDMVLEDTIEEELSKLEEGLKSETKEKEISNDRHNTTEQKLRDTHRDHSANHHEPEPTLNTMTLSKKKTTKQSTRKSPIATTSNGAKYELIIPGE